MDEDTELLQRIDKFVPADIITGVLAYWIKKHPQGTLDTDKIYTMFYQLSQSHSDLFEAFYFYLCGNRFHSKELEDILMQAGTWGIITIDAPRYRTLRVNQSLFSAVNDILDKRYGAEMLKALERLSDEFEALR